MNWPVTIAVLVMLAIGLALLTTSGEDDAGPTAAVAEATGEARSEDGMEGTTSEAPTTDTTPTPDPTPAPAPTFAPPPEVPDGPLDPELAALLDELVSTPLNIDTELVAAVADAGDARLLWVLSDVLRMAREIDVYTAATDAAISLSEIDLAARDFAWGPLTDHLIAWDLPAFDGYVEAKAALFTALEPRWRPFFDAPSSDIDWRLVSWGGVLIDDRELGDPNPCLGSCIPSLDDPGLTDAADGDWYPDDAIVFGVRIGDEAVAFPRNIMEVHEMVNMTLGGRHVAIPYCTLCGAAQVFFTDVEGGGTGDIVMRTSGLLHRSNKVMYDLTTQSVFDTFTGAAVSGPLHADGVVLQQSPVVTTTWAEWREANPDTSIVAEDGGIGRRYSEDPLRGRDDDGPIFPIGDRDDRLGVQEPVLGVVLGDGTPIAFPVADALAAIEAGDPVTLGGVDVAEEAGGLVATMDGTPLGSHQAFWFAWSQFHPDTLLWDAAG